MAKRKRKQINIPLSQSEATELMQAVCAVDVRKHRDILIDAPDALFPRREVHQLLVAQRTLRDWLTECAESRSAAAQAARPRDGWMFALWAASSRMACFPACQRIERVLHPPAVETPSEVDDDVVSELRETVGKEGWSDDLSYWWVKTETDDQLALF